MAANQTKPGNHSEGQFAIPSLGCIAPKQLQKALQQGESLLMAENGRERVEPTRGWARRFPLVPGVYAVFEKGKHEPIYIGETGCGRTGCIQNRMVQLISRRRHVLRRSLGNDKFRHVEGFTQATHDHPFPRHIEVQVNEYMRKWLTVAAVEVRFGRTEIQEHMIRKYKPIYNKVGRAHP